MAVDLKIRNSFGSTSVLLFDDHLVQLEHSHTSDRVRRIRFDRIESIVHWRVIPLGRAVLFGLLLGIPGTALALASDPIAQFLGFLILGIMMVIVGRYLYFKKSNIKITRAGRDYSITGIVSPRKVQNLIEKLESNIRRVQQRPTEPTIEVDENPDVDDTPFVEESTSDRAGSEYQEKGQSPGD